MEITAFQAGRGFKVTKSLSIAKYLNGIDRLNGSIPPQLALKGLLPV